jgi:hypothetical protein
MSSMWFRRDDGGVGYGRMLKGRRRRAAEARLQSVVSSWPSSGVPQPFRNAAVASDSAGQP